MLLPCRAGINLAIKTKKRKTDTRWSRISQKIAIPQSPRNHLDVGTDESKVRAFHKENQEKKKKAYQTYVNDMLKTYWLSSAATCQALQNALCHQLVMDRKDLPEAICLWRYARLWILRVSLHEWCTMPGLEHHLQSDGWSHAVESSPIELTDS